ncbi:hypothetical protein A7P53_11755 [Acinetobacter defluvii]|uniref:hypothetical protein n=1 Tax=Acinetobacter defluvii TaxID=1871111 RepID=UPI00148FF33C|nr:hypothetical protein [Acinetobacter defluvii]NNP73238.1 hypothetical protein [Acinetobacter defluvii]
MKFSINKKLMVKVIVFFVITAIIAVGYWVYVDTNKRKEQEMLRLAQEANSSILSVGNNP